MPDRSRKQPSASAAPEKDPIAAELGRRGGIKGGRARAERLPPELRRAIAQRAAATRWARQRAAAEGEKPVELPGIAAAEATGVVTLAGHALQVARLADGSLVVGQLSAESTLGEAVAAGPEAATLAFRTPGEWQVRRGLRPDEFVRLLAARAAAGHAVALDVLVACAAAGLGPVIGASLEEAARRAAVHLG